MTQWEHSTASVQARFCLYDVFGKKVGRTIIRMTQEIDVRKGLFSPDSDAVFVNYGALIIIITKLFHYRPDAHLLTFSDFIYVNF